MLAACVSRTADLGTNAPSPAPKPSSKPAAYPYGVAANAACTIDGRIYVTGGFGNRNQKHEAALLNHAWRYDPQANAWQRLADMPQSCCFHAMATAAGRVFVFGGIGEGTGRDASTRPDVMAFDPATNKWSIVGKLPTPRNRFAAATIGDRIFVVAGMELREHLENTAVVDVLNARTLRWTRAADLPSTGHGHGLAAAGDTLVVAGGMGDLRETWLYDSVADKWRKGATLPETRLFPAAAAVGGKVYLVGNRESGDIPLLRYDLASDKWEQIAPASVRTHRTAGAELGGLIYVIGGEGEEGGELARVSRYDPATGVWVHSD